MVKIFSAATILLAILITCLTRINGVADEREMARYLPTNHQVWAEKKADLEIAQRQFGKSHPRVIYLRSQLEAFEKIQASESGVLPEDFDRDTLLKTIRQLQQDVQDLQEKLERLEQPKPTGRFDDQA
jgi:hypothetical protein